ncbi:hypothetical protein HS088_TW05G00584 [Tripterygium wilfordii]|uniref:PHD-type domain-containing protein n=1 Tax=Tripterygium wilfordii TaxID=458696 RepID=A0A7J7DNB4_TRIWF|nr:uncharacterized protein LOC119998709 [Tripterygium wilfordii]KAF5747855.1 hypothetical protein HS088_TW05G00584 [Tripterygium wilfordii]
MKREVAYVLEVQSQLVGSLGENRSCITQSPPETRATCCTEAESVCPKRFRVTDVNGFIVYTRLKKSRINGCSKLRENPVNGRIKSLEEEPELDSTSSSIEEEGLATDNVLEKNEALDKQVQANHLVDSGIEAGIVAEAVNRKEPNGSAVEEEEVGLGNADCKENVALLRQYSRATLKMKVTMEAADGRASSVVEQISQSEQSTADKEGVAEAPLNFMESSKPPKRSTRSALKLMEEQVEVTVHGMEVIDNRSNCRAISAVGSISRSEQSPSDKEGLGEAPLNFTESRKPRRFTRSTLKAKEEPVEVTVQGVEAIDHETTSRIDVEMIAEGSALAASKKNLELKMSKKISVDKKPMTVKELFETGLLEGVPVIYMGGKKAFGLRGTVKDVGILCSCSLCKGFRVIPPSQFEIHACNQYRRAAQYVCFENGKSLLDVLKACRAAPLHELEATIQSAISSSAEDRSFICIKCKGSFPPSCVGKLGPLCISCSDSKESGDGPSCAIVDIRTRLPEPEPYLIPKLPKSDSTFDSPQCSKLKITRKSSKTDLLAVTYKSAFVHKSSRLRSQWKTTSKSIKTDLITKASKSASVPISSKRKSQRKSAPKSSKPAAISKSFKNASAYVSLQNKCQWKLTTKRDQRLHKLVFEEGGLPDGTEVAYYGRGQKMLEGYKKGFGIFCCCCNCEVSPSQFEVHAGWASRKKPYSYIYLSNGVSLHELAISLSKGRKYSAKDNDDVCVICADGGNLLLCDGCPRAFHKDCASLSSVPRGDWYCRYCENMFQREKFVEHNANAIAAGRVSGIDPIEQLTKRCIRIVKSIEQELSGCAICRLHDFSKSGFGPRTVILCDQCEKEHHVGCLKTQKIANLKELPKGKWFCCVDCSKIHSTLQKLLICGAERLPDSFLNVLKKKHEEKELGTITDIDVRWRLLSSKISSSETRSLLSQAVGIFHECFDPIVDSATGRDLIPYMVYGRNLKGQEYGGMYCAILTVNSTVVSAGILRVFGLEVAELPLVATSKDNHGKGYFQLLFSCIEKLLGVLNVKTLVLPAAAEAESIWTDRFGFQKIKPDQLSRYRRSCCQMVTFQGTSMLQKSIPACSVVNKSTGGFIESCCAVE